MREQAPGARERLAEDPALAIARRHRTLEEVVAWGLASSPPRLVARVVVQDEYTHDVVMPFEDRYLVYDTT